jgi:hypothetical protein
VPGHAHVAGLAALDRIAGRIQRPVGHLEVTGPFERAALQREILPSDCHEGAVHVDHEHAGETADADLCGAAAGNHPFAGVGILGDPDRGGGALDAGMSPTGGTSSARFDRAVGVAPHDQPRALERRNAENGDPSMLTPFSSLVTWISAWSIPLRAPFASQPAHPRRTDGCCSRP